MSSYIVKDGETISDVALNACGSILALNDILELNSFTEWTPDLKANQNLVIPDVIDFEYQKELTIYPACSNAEIVNLDSQINDLTDILNNITVVSFILPINETIQTNTYKVRDGETIRDAVLNSTGSILNWNQFLETNSFTEWTPTIKGNQSLIIPNIETQTNVLEFLKLFPACNSNIIANLDDQISNLISNFNPPTKVFEDGIIFTFEDGIKFKYQNE